tara:strand:+ start:2245 stop:3084 length:840 start_codon:yes stop_codon:yes gene_type:complete
MNIIGIGSAGCRISDYLSKYDVYSTFQIDTEDSEYDNFVQTPAMANHEEYEGRYENLNLDNIDGPTTIILSGAGAISGIILRLLEQISDRSKINILYIKPRTTEMSSLQTTRHRICSQVLQQYVRSSMLDSMMMVDNEKVEAIISDIELDNYWRPINMLIAESFHMVNVLKNTEPLLKSSNMVPQTAKISTFSVVDFENGKEEILYDLQYPRAKNFYLALSEAFIKDNKSLLSDVRSFTTEQQTDDCDCAYAIYKTDYPQNYVYGVHHASFIQEQNLDL